jgi:aerobic carbon-monoxide dehydrogenase medium subunit
MTTVEFRSVTTVDQALDSLTELGEDAQLLAGGTDVMVQYQRGELRPKALVHLEGVAELRDIEHDGSVRLGALVTHRRVPAMLGDALPALSEACATVGGWQTQEVGTVVGNICNASPAADAMPPLLTAGTVVELVSGRGSRSLTLDEFVLGRRRTARAPDELVTSIRLEPLPAGAGEVYLKVAPRSTMEVALIGLAVRIRFDDDERVIDARVATCSVGPVPRRIREAEEPLVGGRLEHDALAEAAERLHAAADPIDDARASAAYRRRVLGPLLERAVTMSRERARGTSRWS